MDNREVAKKIAEEAIVLLKNEEQLLPFDKGQKAAVFGRAQIDTIYSGNGSGRLTNRDAEIYWKNARKEGSVQNPV